MLVHLLLSCGSVHTHLDKHTLQSRIEEDYQRWDQAVKSAKDNRSQDEERFCDAETTLLDQIHKLKGDSAKYESAISEVCESSALCCYP